MLIWIFTCLVALANDIFWETVLFSKEPRGKLLFTIIHFVLGSSPLRDMLLLELSVPHLQLGAQHQRQAPAQQLPPLLPAEELQGHRLLQGAHLGAATATARQ